MRRLLAALFLPILLLSSLAGTAQADAAHQEPFRALLFTKAVGYVHSSIPAGIQMVEEMAAEHGFEVVQTADSNAFEDANLATFDVLIMLQNSGMVWENDAQRQALQKFVRSGKGVVAVHNAMDMGIENDFPWWDDLVNGGAHMPAHSPGVLQGTAKVADRVHPSTKNLPLRWERPEEWYNFSPNPRGDVHVLVTADETTYDPGGSAMGPDHPISWCRKAEGGKVWATAMGHDTAAYAEPLFREHVRGGIGWAAGVEEGDCGGTVHSSFEKITLDDNTADPMELDVAADGRVFYVQRRGEVKIFKPDTHATVTAATLNVYTGGEDGLIGMELDPKFAENGWIYLYWSPADSAEDVNRLSRFTVSGDGIDLDTEKKILEVPAYRSRTFPEPGHTGGAVEFGPDGTLYLSTGDDVPPNLSPDWQGYAPIDWRPGEEMLDAARTAGNTNDLRGKILRIEPKADGGYDIPEGNLFPPGTDKTKPEIYAMGFRNPFRFTVDQKTGYVHMADYGPDRGLPTTERGPEGLVEYNVIREAGNYGWPFCHGDNQPYAPYNPDTKVVGPKFDCTTPVNDSPNNTGLTELPPIQAPIMWYGYGTSPVFPELGADGAAPMMGPVYRYEAGNPSTTKFPAYFDGVGFFYEWSRNYIKEVHRDADDKVLKINDFLANLSFVKPMDMTFGPDGSMYLLEWGSAFGGGNNDSGLYRIDYSAGARAPVAKGAASRTNGPAPLSVEFDSAGSYDPDGDSITFAWDFDGDGTFDSTEPKVTHVYQEPGRFTAQLKVTDSTGKEGFANIEVTAGNTAPTVALEAPVNGTLIDFGTDVPYKVTVTDPEDGTIDCQKVFVNPALGHDDHEHDTTEIPGCQGTISTSDLGGHPAGANLYYVINAHYTDQSDIPLTGYAKVVLQPKRKQAEYFTSMSGVRVIDQSAAESGKRIGDISNGDWIAFTPMDLNGMNSVAYRASSPNGGGSIELRAGSPTGTLLATTPVPATGGWDTYQMTASVPVKSDVRTQTLYVVFKNSANNGFDLDAIQFAGEGAGDGPDAGVYTLTAQHSGKNVAVKDASTADNALIVQMGATGGNEQQWEAMPLSAGGYQFKNVKSGKCLDVPSGSTTAGTQLVQWTCHPDTHAHQIHQRFQPALAGEVYKITSAASGLCVDVNGVSQADGAAVVQYNCTDTDNQRFRLTAPQDDETPPVTTVKVADPGGEDGWYSTGPVEVTLTATDGGSGVAATEYRLDEGAWTIYTEPVLVSGDGSRKLEYRSRDGAGNVEEPGSRTLKIDTLAPQTTADFAAPNDEGWNDGDVPVVLTAQDATSGVTRVEYSLDQGEWKAYAGEPVVVTGDRSHELRYRARDAAGTTEQEKAAVLKIDGTRPTLMVSGVSDGEVYGDAQDLRISWEAVDATSGVKTMSGTLEGDELRSDTIVPLFSRPLTRQTVSVTANDNAGNSVTTNVKFTVTTSLRDMQNLLDRFRATSWLSLDAHTSLTKELTKARTAEAKGKDAEALRQLREFKALVGDQALVPRADVRQVLTRDADKMIEVIG
ncbi:ThuA domain-containing protein [Nonomuraea sp. K274]|uniref:ThuA domain-containing protein n=1 Tax=Nonomuraea cypriaca TaxID=1187855 RepID=A0A931AIU4_9ACTN|nr:ThuA domain-containing protein [Nonomuraea cypriaca]MBF8191298.1 ThuA domain-containing protein [Nonomuraea cypriaca]